MGNFKEICQSMPGNSIECDSKFEKDVSILRYTESGKIPDEAWSVIREVIDLTLKDWWENEYNENVINRKELRELHGPPQFSMNW